MNYTQEVENMCIVKKGPNHGPAEFGLQVLDGAGLVLDRVLNFLTNCHIFYFSLLPWQLLRRGLALPFAGAIPHFPQNRKTAPLKHGAAAYAQARRLAKTQARIATTKKTMPAMRVTFANI